MSAKDRLERTLEAVRDLAGPGLAFLVPRVVAVIIFLAGAVLLISASLPTLPERLVPLSRLVPLGLLEVSHLFSGVIGLGLLILARGLYRRLDGAWHVAVGMLVVGIVAALLRGFDWEEAGLLVVALLLLLVTHRHFHRRASLLHRPFGLRWLIGVAVVVVAAGWLGFVAYSDERLSQSVFWQVSFDGNLPRFLRGQIAIALAVAIYGLFRLLRGAPPSIEPLDAAHQAKLEELIAQSPMVSAAFAYLGDKHFLFDDEDRAFVMYGISGDSWIALGDPIGDPEVFSDLVWKYREQCDLHDERPVFYQVTGHHLPVYLDAGLSAIKLGESGKTSLADFNLDGGRRRDLRQAVRRAEREGLSFALHPPEEVEDLLPELRRVSDDWLRSKNAREKGFSLGFFNDDFLCRFPVAVGIRDGSIVAFANVLRTFDKETITVDLMRYDSSAPYGVMDYLFTQTMLWGRDNGYRYFSLGMAPLAGLEQHPLAPLWNRVGAWIFRHGEHFYNFRGLRAYKEKFTPVWEPRYLIAPGGLSTTRALADVATLIAGSWGGLVRR